MMRAASKIVTSAHSPGRSRPRSKRTDLGRVRRRHLPDRFLHREDLRVAHVAAEHARKRAVVARVRVTRGERAVGRDGPAIRADGDEGLRQRMTHVLLAVVEVDGRDRAAVLGQELEEHVDREACREPAMTSFIRLPSNCLYFGFESVTSSMPSQLPVAV